MNNRLFGLSGTNFTSQQNPSGEGGPGHRSKEDNPNSAANQMRHNFTNDLKMARENSMVGNYSISVQKYRRVVKMVEKFMMDGCAPPLLQKWRLVTQ